jgi:hypothetical protein
MTEEWPNAVWIVIAILIFVSVIGFSTSMFYAGQRVQSRLLEDDRQQELMKEYREYNAYNDKDVYCQDVVSAILKSHGAPYVEVIDGSNKYYWQANQAIATTKSIPVQNETAYNSTAILTKLSLNNMYAAQVIKGDNFEVVGISFTKK